MIMFMIDTILGLAFILGVYVGIVFLVDRLTMNSDNRGSLFIDVTDTDDEW